MKILFISRAYPPIVGGIENQNWELERWLGKIAEIKIIANKRGKKFLPFFLPFAAIKSLIIARKYDAILLGDGVLGIIAYKLKFFYPKKPIICVIHGLDLTFESAIYQKLWVNKFLKNNVDKFIAVGNETARIATEKGISPEKVVFIPNGVDTEKNLCNSSKRDLEKIIGENLENKKIILTSGRLAKRKGVAWFVENVLPKLPEKVYYIIAGQGPDQKNIERAVLKTNSQKRVKLLGYVTDKTRNILYNSCDLFIQPNIKMHGDIEGFGISVIEAAACRLPVVASELEGLKDAIKHEQNGFLIEPHNAEAFKEKITELLENELERKAFGEKARQFVVDNYSWDKIAKKYLEEIEKNLKK